MCSKAQFHWVLWSISRSPIAIQYIELPYLGPLPIPHTRPSIYSCNPAQWLSLTALGLDIEIQATYTSIVHIECHEQFRHCMLWKGNTPLTGPAGAFFPCIISIRGSGRRGRWEWGSLSWDRVSWQVKDLVSWLPLGCCDDCCIPSVQCSRWPAGSIDCWVLDSLMRIFWGEIWSCWIRIWISPNIVKNMPLEYPGYRDEAFEGPRPNEPYLRSDAAKGL